MSEQIREQISAFLDGELPGAEAELLLKRLTRDVELRESFGRYALIGESMRGGPQARLSQGFSARVNRAIDGEPATVPAPVRARAPARWWRPVAGTAVAAGVATVALVALQQRATEEPARLAASAGQNMTTMSASVPTHAAPGAQLASGAEPISYVTPVATGENVSLAPQARLTNYVFAHSKYSSVLGQNDVLNDLLSSADAEAAAAAAATQGLRVAP